MLHDDTNGGVLTTVEAGRLLRNALAEVNVDKVDLIFSDTCLNGMVEVLEELGSYADCVVASSEAEPGYGWDYSRWFGLMAHSPPANAADWGRSAVLAFDDGYRDREQDWPVTLGAFRCRNSVTAAFAGLVNAARPHGAAGFFELDGARRLSQAFANRDAYDLIDFSVLLAQSGIAEIASAAERLKRACEDARVHAIARGPTVDRSNGIAFWFPASRHSLLKDAETYKRLEFARRTGWPTYLEDFYAGKLVHGQTAAAPMS